ncbi:hypothetical protein [Streptomyces sp. NPDC056600]|uniref:hypothetical protein n=1 Tax=Streptomyces sp. NPDC056600 TaxID=3345874 RepID=UPI0036999B3B
MLLGALGFSYILGHGAAQMITVARHGLADRPLLLALLAFWVLSFVVKSYVTHVSAWK